MTQHYPTGPRNNHVLLYQARRELRLRGQTTYQMLSSRVRHQSNQIQSFKDAQGLQNASSFHDLMIGIQYTMRSPLHNWADQVKKE